MPLSDAAILAYEQKQNIFEMPQTFIFIFILQASFVSILKPLLHLGQFYKYWCMIKSLFFFGGGKEAVVDARGGVLAMLG